MTYQESNTDKRSFHRFRGVRWVMGAIFILGGIVWLSAVLWPPLPAGSWPFVAELQASAFLGIIAILVGGSLIRSFRSASFVLILSIVGVLTIPRIPMSFSPEEEDSIRVMSLNTFFAQADDATIIDTTMEIHPDILALEETSQQEVAAVVEGTDYIALNEPLPGEGPGSVVLMVSPEYLEKMKNNGGYHVRLVPGVTTFQLPMLTVADGTTFIAVHPVAPIGDKRGAWVQELENMKQWVRPMVDSVKHSEKEDEDIIQNIVMMGDFNATHWHPEYRGFGMKDCTGHLGHTPTWPSSFPMIRIDHVLSTGTCKDGGVIKVEGTDHRAVWADLNV